MAARVIAPQSRRTPPERRKTLDFLAVDQRRRVAIYQPLDSDPPSVQVNNKASNAVRLQPRHGCSRVTP